MTVDSTILNQVERLVRYAANQYAIPGVLASEDLYQEGMLVLLEVLNELNEAEKSDEELVVRKLKAHLWYAMKYIPRHYRAKKRDVRSTVSSTELDVYDLLPDEYYLNPEEVCIHRDTEAFFDILLSELETDGDFFGSAVLSELVFPSELPDGVESSYERMPVHRSINMLSRLMDLPWHTVRRALERVRSAYLDLAPVFDAPVPYVS